MNSLSLLLQGVQAKDCQENVFNSSSPFKVIDDAPVDGTAFRIQETLKMWFNKQAPYISQPKPGEVIPVMLTEWGWEATKENTEFYRFENQKIIQPYAEDEKKERVGFWNRVKSKMKTLQTKSIVGAVGSAIGSMMSFVALAHPIGGLVLLAIAAGFSLVAFLAKARKNEAEAQATSWDNSPEDLTKLASNDDTVQQPPQTSLGQDLLMAKGSGVLLNIYHFPRG